MTVIATGISSIEEPEISQLEVVRSRQTQQPPATTRSRMPRLLDDDAMLSEAAAVSIAKPNLLPKGLPRMPKPIFDDHELNEYEEPAYLRKKAN